MLIVQNSFALYFNLLLENNECDVFEDTDKYSLTQKEILLPSQLYALPKYSITYTTKFRP